MKITVTQLRKIIKEEVQKAKQIKEGPEYDVDHGLLPREVDMLMKLTKQYGTIVADIITDKTLDQGKNVARLTQEKDDILEMIEDILMSSPKAKENPEQIKNMIDSIKNFG